MSNTDKRQRARQKQAQEQAARVPGLEAEITSLTEKLEAETTARMQAEVLTFSQKHLIDDRDDTIKFAGQLHRSLQTNLRYAVRSLVAARAEAVEHRDTLEKLQEEHEALVADFEGSAKLRRRLQTKAGLIDLLKGQVSRHKKEIRQINGDDV